MKDSTPDLFADLFDSPAGREIKDIDIRLPDAPHTPDGRRPLARKTDPETSHEAVPDADELARLHQWTVDCVRESPGMTQRELGAKYCPTDPRKIGRRLNEVERLYRTVKRGPKRKCRESGRSAETWWPAEACG